MISISRCRDLFKSKNGKEAVVRMKLKDLIDVLDSEADVTFEILGEIETVGCLAKDLLESYEYASNYEVSKLGVGYYVEHGEVIPTFIVEVVQQSKIQKRKCKIHKLKILLEYFEAIVSGKKRFEIRKNDRNYLRNKMITWC